jgi:hypothetical protein
MTCLNNSEVDNQQQLQSLVNECEALVMVFDLSNVSMRQFMGGNETEVLCYSSVHASF